MKRSLIVVAATAVLAAIAAGAALATKPPHPKVPHPGTAANGKKVWICHRTHSARNPYVAIRIPAKQLANGIGHGAARMEDVMNATATAATPVPQTRAAARAYCKSLGPLTTRKGGHELNGTLTASSGATLTGTNLIARLRRGQAELCLAATITSTTSPTITVTAISLTQGATTTTLSGFTTPLPVAAASPVQLATCAPLSRTLVASILTGTATTLTISTSAGNLTATLT